MNNFFVDRVITITGSPENTSKAEALVSEKMRKCFEQDAQNYNVSVEDSPSSNSTLTPHTHTHTLPPPQLPPQNVLGTVFYIV